MLSKQQRRAINFFETDHSMYLAEGAVRSGKTHAVTLGFFVWSQRREAELGTFTNEYAFVGRSATTLERNVIKPLRDFCSIFNVQMERNRGYGYLDIGGVRYWTIGVNDVRAEDKIQGMTAAGAMVDEIALLSESFIMQLLARLSVKGAKLVATYNPENPAHWLKKKIIDRLEDYGGIMERYVMDDNPSLSEEIKERYKKQFVGHYYKRYVEGQWAAPAGVIYPFLELEEYKYKDYDELIFSMDYAAAGVWCVLEWRRNGKEWWCVDEIYEDFRESVPMTDEEMVQTLHDWIRDRRYTAIIIDPATHVRWKRKARGMGMNLRYPTHQTHPCLLYTSPSPRD